MAKQNVKLTISKAIWGEYPDDALSNYTKNASID